MSYNYDKEYVVRPCKWNPTAGKLYRSYDNTGFYVNEHPTLMPRGYARPFPHDGRGIIDKLNHGDIFMYLGGRQRCPDHYTAFRILFGEQIRWLIYPERWHNWHERQPIDPIRL